MRALVIGLLILLAGPARADFPAPVAMYGPVHDVFEALQIDQGDCWMFARDPIEIDAYWREHGARHAFYPRAPHVIACGERDDRGWACIPPIVRDLPHAPPIRFARDGSLADGEHDGDRVAF